VSLHQWTSQCVVGRLSGAVKRGLVRRSSYGDWLFFDHEVNMNFDFSFFIEGVLYFVSTIVEIDYWDIGGIILCSVRAILLLIVICWLWYFSLDFDDVLISS